MSARDQIVFLVSLLQDVNIVRPLALLAASELDVEIRFLTSARFAARDTAGTWKTEVDQLAQDVNGVVEAYRSPLDAFMLLQRRRGVLIAASESSLGGHAETHDVFRAAPGDFLKVTLQHGFECVGFLHNRDHDKAHGRNIRFAADVLAGWCHAPRLTAIAAAERPKLYVSGPPLLAQPRPASSGPTLGGLVCENLHSVRMNVSGDFKAPFMETFNAYAADLDKGAPVTLRPHPGGQYVLKNNVPLPRNAILNNAPIYKVDLSRYAFGISAPSSVIIDMVLSGLPVGVWQDPDGMIDASNYAGLARVQGLGDWHRLAAEATANRPEFVRRQNTFIEQSGLVADPETVRSRFLALMGGAARRVGAVGRPVKPIRKVLFVANGLLPTLQICFYKPLQPLIDAGEIEAHLITEAEIRERFPDNSGDHVAGGAAEAWVREQIAAYDPSVLVFCRYSGPHAAAMMDAARSTGAGVMFHIDDDLLNVPIEIGAIKHRKHNRPNRLEAVKSLLNGADLVYCSNEALKRRVQDQGFDAPVVTGPMHCCGEVLRPATERPVTRMGYMGFDHAHDLETILEPLCEVLRRHPHVHFELFGSIPKPEALEAFGDRISVRPPVRDYEAFLNEFAALDWDIGICPLALTEFNTVKANNKWVEYTSVGAAVVATRGMAYDECCSDGCGDLVSSPEEWLQALDRLCSDPALRADRVTRAQARLRTEYSLSRLTRQVIGKLRETLDRAAARPQASLARRLS